MSGDLPAGFRKLSVSQRRERLREAFSFSQDELDATIGGPGMLDLAGIMVETAIGVMPVPMGLAHGFLIDGTIRSVPLAVEEPSVVAAAGYAAAIVRRAGGFRTWATDPVMSAQVVFDGGVDERQLMAMEPEIREHLAPVLRSMEQRGGGYRGIEVSRLPETGLVRLLIHVDVRDAMGANILNSAAERTARYLEQTLGCSVLMAILTNAGTGRLAGAEFSVPVDRLARAGFTGEQVASRIELAARFAHEDRDRAVTHNKGIMNGISSLAIATGNDTRGIEAAVHAWAARDGSYRGLSSFSVSAGHLVGRLEAPLPFGVVGGAVGVHPATRFALKLLGSPDAVTLSRISAAVGLAQNFAAVYALVTEGIQGGHMRLHCERLAWMAGARGEEISLVAQQLSKVERYNVTAARAALGEIRNTE